jgi:hypothetical protein
MRVYWDMAFFAWKLRTMVDGFSLLMYPREGRCLGNGNGTCYACIEGQDGLLCILAVRGWDCDEMYCL